MAARREAVLTSAAPRSLSVIVGEGALRHQTGASPMMREQLRDLASLSRRAPGVTVRVLPFLARVYASNGEFAVMRFASASGMAIVHLPGVLGGVYVDHEASVETYAGAFERIRAQAMTARESERLMRELAALK